MEPSINRQTNPLATEKISKLIIRFAIPAIVSGLVSSLYNIVDQIFIGHKIGFLGNAATNVAFPLVTICVAFSILLGVGSSANFNLAQGRGETERATQIIGNGIALMILCGFLYGLAVFLFTEPIVRAFGAGPDTLAYSVTYTRITSIGIPFLIISNGGSNLVRADGSPRFAMYSTLLGAILNIGLDYLFMYPLQMGIAGAALATIIGQIISAMLVLHYFRNFKTVRLQKQHFRLRPNLIKLIFALGIGGSMNQLSMMIVQVTMNNTLTHYGEMSLYGRDIPLAVVGVISKISMITMSVCVGTAQGCQPIIGYNYGAKNYARVKETYLKASCAIFVFSIACFLCFQIFPRQITAIFGGGSEEYFRFAEQYFRIYMFMAFINGQHPLTVNFFTAIGKAKIGMALSVTRQLLFLLPLILILPYLFGIDGVMYAGPIADLSAFILVVICILRELRLLDQSSTSSTPT